LRKHDACEEVPVASFTEAQAHGIPLRTRDGLSRRPAGLG